MTNYIISSFIFIHKLWKNPTTVMLLNVIIVVIIVFEGNSEDMTWCLNGKFLPRQRSQRSGRASVNWTHLSAFVEGAAASASKNIPRKNSKKQWILRFLKKDTLIITCVHVPLTTTRYFLSQNQKNETWSDVIMRAFYDWFSHGVNSVLQGVFNVKSDCLFSY